MHHAHRSFLVIVHDVAPPFLAPLRTIGRELARLVGRAVAGAVVPHWHGAQPSAQCAALVEYARATFGEVLLHGYSHRSARPRGPVALLTDGADELSALAPGAAVARLRAGRARLSGAFGTPISGLVAPAWQPGPVTPALLAACGLDYLLGFWRLAAAGAPDRPLAVWSWDCGRVAALGLAGEALGAARRALRPAAIPCVVLHPRDVARGYLARALRLIEGLREAGWRPALPAACLPGSPARQ